mgnify:CR=1 FL=1
MIRRHNGRYLIDANVGYNLIMENKPNPSQPHGWREFLDLEPEMSQGLARDELEAFAVRAQHHWAPLVSKLHKVYGERPDLTDHLGRLRQIGRAHV